MERYRVAIRFTEDVLGSVSTLPVYQAYQADKAQANGKYVSDEFATVVDQNRGRTAFHREGGMPIIYDYVIKGFLKEACRASKAMPGSASAKLTAYKSKIDTLVHVTPRRIQLRLSKPTTDNQRPLRADTPQGPRVTVVSSEAAQAGTRMEFEIVCLAPAVIGETLIREWLEFGQWSGIGQWRSGGHGRFEVVGFEAISAAAVAAAEAA